MKLQNLFALAAFVALSASSQAQTTTYNSLSSFNSVLGASYTETFDFASGAYLAPQTLSSNGFSYDIDSLSHQLYITSATDPALGALFTDDTLTINFTSGNVTAVGGSLFLSDIDDAPIAGQVHALLNDGTALNYAFDGSDTFPFAGFTSSVPLTSLSIFASTPRTYITLDNFVVGTAVPEPGTMAMLTGMGFTGAGFLLRRRK